MSHKSCRIMALDLVKKMSQKSCRIMALDLVEKMSQKSCFACYTKRIASSLMNRNVGQQRLLCCFTAPTFFVSFHVI